MQEGADRLQELVGVELIERIGGVGRLGFQGADRGEQEIADLERRWVVEGQGRGQIEAGRVLETAREDDVQVLLSESDGREAVLLRRRGQSEGEGVGA